MIKKHTTASDSTASLGTGAVRVEKKRTSRTSKHSKATPVSGADAPPVSEVEAEKPTTGEQALSDSVPVLPEQVSVTLDNTGLTEGNTSADVMGVGQIDGGEVSRLAYSYWESRGFRGGSPEEDWMRAEQELRGCQAAKGR